MTRIACLTVQRDETLLLRPWLLYHGYLIGFENLFVFDENSANPAVRATLEEFRALGVNIETAPAGEAGLTSKDDVFAARITAFRETGAYDIAIALDSDEFLCINGAAGISCLRNELHEELARINAGGETCWTEDCLENQPLYLDLFRYTPRSRGIGVVREFPAAGYDFNAARPSASATSLMLVRLCHGPFADFIAGPHGRYRWRAELSASPHSLKRRNTKNPANGSIALTEAEYLRDLGGYEWPLLRFRALFRLLAAMMDMDQFSASWAPHPPPGLPASMIEIDLDETPFIKSSYLAANPDLPRTGMNLLHHFMKGGYPEGRLLENSPAGRQEVADRLALLRARKSDGISGYAGLALSLNRIGQASEAETLLLEGIAKFGETLVLLRERALLAQYSADYAQASALWRRFVERFADRPDGYQYGARAHRAAGLYDESRALALEGRARFPNHLGIAIEDAETALRCNDLIRAAGLWDELLRKYPENKSVREGAAAAAFKIRLARLDNLEQEQVDVMDGPVIVTMSEAEKQDALRRLGLSDLQAMRKLFMQFEGLGKNCEFGLVQRRFGAEPIGLFRWNSIHIPNLIKGLERNFIDFDDPSNLLVVKVGAEYVVRDLVYATSMHTFNNINEITEERVLEQQIKRTAYLKRKLLAELELGEKIFVHLGDHQRYPQAPAQLFDAISAYGDGTLLFVCVDETHTKSGTIDIINERFMIGYLDRLGRVSDGGWNIDFDSWLSVCAAAVAHVAAVRQQRDTAA
jgi:tetratricopeptide (TPR) repeat protein